MYVYRLVRETVDSALGYILCSATFSLYVNMIVEVACFLHLVVNAEHSVEVGYRSVELDDNLRRSVCAHSALVYLATNGDIVAVDALVLLRCVVLPTALCLFYFERRQTDVFLTPRSIRDSDYVRATLPHVRLVDELRRCASVLEVGVAEIYVVAPSLFALVEVEDEVYYVGKVYVYRCACSVVDSDSATLHSRSLLAAVVSSDSVVNDAVLCLGRRCCIDTENSVKTFGTIHLHHKF